MPSSPATAADFVAAIRPVTSRVRTTDSAVKGSKGSYWTDEPLTPAILAEHVAGGRARGACPMQHGSSTTLIALLDFDSHRGETPWEVMVAVVQQVLDALEVSGLRGIVWRSSGGNGIHVIVVWDRPQDAYSVREALREALGRCALEPGAKGVQAGQVEVFPKQDEVGPDEKGNQFILPLAGKSVPVDMMLGVAAGREAALTLDWPVSDDVPVLTRPVRSAASGAEPPDPISKVTSALAAIPNDGLLGDLDYEAWHRIVCAVHEATGGSEEGLQAAQAWSAQNSRHDAKFLRERVWPYIRAAGDRTKAVRRNTLYGAARDNGWSNAPVADADGFEDVPYPVAVAGSDSLTAQEGAVESSEKLVEKWREVLDRADTLDDIQDRICPRIAKDKLLGDIDRALVADLVQSRLRDLGANVTITLVRKLVALKAPKTVERFDVSLEVKPLTEFGNAQRMIDRFGPSLMFVPEHDSWFKWSAAKKLADGTDGPPVYWRRVSTVEIEHLAKETIKALAQEIDQFPDDRRSEFFEFCRMSQTAKMVSNMVRLAASDPRVYVPASELDKHAHLVAARNGVVDLRNGRLHAADSRLRITKVLGCDYDPNAQAPLWAETLSGVFKGDADLVEFFLRTLGYALQGEPKEDVMVIPYGNGSNGKSTCYGIARKAFGTYSRSADAGTFIADSGQKGGGGAREDLVRLQGARLVLVGEPDENGELREGSVKSMTGGDALTARAMYAKTSLEFLPTWTIVMPTNYKPIIKGSDHGIWRRLRLIPFEVNFDKDPGVTKDGDREKRLEAELSGVLTAIVNAGLRYRESGLTPPGKVRDAVQAYKQDMDLLSEWIEECCDVGPDYQCNSGLLWDSWARYAQGRGLLRFISNSKALGRRMDQRFPTKKGTGGVRVRIGIRVKYSEDLF
ncbi:MAG: Burkholderia virus BcepC6B [Pseudomonadota bacterium]|jgi:P4 family phage/plasmid primase-like protien